MEGGINLWEIPGEEKNYIVKLFFDKYAIKVRAKRDAGIIIIDGGVMVDIVKYGDKITIYDIDSPTGKSLLFPQC